MKNLFLGLALVFSSSAVFAMGEEITCTIQYNKSKQTLKQKCTKYTLDTKGSFFLIGYMNSPLGEDQQIDIKREKNGNFSLLTQTIHGEEYDLGGISKDPKKAGCYKNEYYNICLK